jgi:hypothetical protein
MKGLAAVVLLLALSAGAANARVHRQPSLRALNLTPPTFRGSGFKPHERVAVSLRGLRMRPVHVKADAHGRFRVRLAAASACRAWTVRAVGKHSGRVLYHHARCAALETSVKGVVWRGPIKNVCSDATLCGAPAAGVAVQALKAGHVVAQTSTAADGSFSFALAAGPYMIRLAAKQAPGRKTAPQAVHVTGATLVHLSFQIDTGIR